MNGRGAAGIAVMASLVTGGLAYVHARDSHSSLSVAVFLFAWAALPSALAAWTLWREPKRVVAPLAFGLITTVGGLGVFAGLALCAQPAADTARHLAPFLWPVVLMLVAAVVAVLLWLVDAP
jgi:hypothetical protein